jgi:PAS domain S-box-containing protein
MCIADAEGHFRKVNPAFLEKLGYEESELLSKPIIEVIHPDDRQPTLDEIARYFREGGVANGFENRNVCRDGTVCLLSWRAYFDQKEGLLYATASDITLRKKTEAALVAARQEAERASQAKSDFLARVTHELRTPLNFILGFAQLMEMDANHLPDVQLDRVRRIIKSGWHLRELIDEVLDLERIEAGNLDIHTTDVGLHAVLAECIDTLELLAAEHQVSVVSPALPSCESDRMVRADATRLKQVLLNLLSNAIKFNRAGGLVTIEQRLTDNGHLRISIADTGPGIEPRRQQELFKPFNRLDADRAEIPGTGVGLAISSRFMQLMEGRIGVESEPGRGSVFWIELPFAEHETFFI